MKCWRILLSVILLLLLASSPVLALENEDEAPAAFVKGTSEYSIPYLEKTRAKLSLHFPAEQFAAYDGALAELKAKNARLIKRIALLRASEIFLKENDRELAEYRELLQKTTFLMFEFLQIFNQRSTLPPR